MIPFGKICPVMELETIWPAWLFFKVYFDFSAYSDIAIDLQILWHQIMENTTTYLALISVNSGADGTSLSDWIRDYLFFPCPNSAAKFVSLLVPVIAMALCGLWHGLPELRFGVCGMELGLVCCSFGTHTNGT